MDVSSGLAEHGNNFDSTVEPITVTLWDD